MRVQNWDVTKKKAIGYPVLNPWMLVSATSNTYTYERNPYYFKIDAAGNQLPYIDQIQSTLVENMEMVQMKMISGDVDFARESASLINMSTYKENEKNGFTTYFRDMHVEPTCIGLNQTFGDDAGYKAMVQDVRFRKALSLAIDRDEIIDSIYYGFADKNSWQDSTYDPAQAEQLLQDMGMKKGSDGFYTQPDGKPFQILIENGAEAPDIVPYCELITEMWKAIGVNTASKRIDAALVTNKQNANQLQCRVIWTHMPLWYMQDWGTFMWGSAWDIWRSNTSEVAITDPDTGAVTMQAVSGEVPPQPVQDFFNLITELMQVSPDQVDGVWQQLRDSMNQNFWYIVPLENVKQPFLANSKLHNIPDNGFAIGANFTADQFWFGN